jgi:thioredoxin reductase (NADPH)/alkyl hydroperoxide reductase subunit F
MAVKPSRIVIIGAGPAGCSAAIMADSVGIETVLIEQFSIGFNVSTIPNLSNILNYEHGPQLATSLRESIERLSNCHVVEGTRVSHVQPNDDEVMVTVDNEECFTGNHVIVATGLMQRQPEIVPWIVLTDITPSYVKRFSELSDKDLAAKRIIVLGADRQLGTFLRSSESLRSCELIVLHSPEEAYKLSEATAQVGVINYGVTGVQIQQKRQEVLIQWKEAGTNTFFTANAELVVNNLGGCASMLRGVAIDRDGYAPNSLQHPRILTAGDIRSPQFQRIATAIGSGAEAALKLYYKAANFSTDLISDV